MRIDRVLVAAAMAVAVGIGAAPAAAASAQSFCDELGGAWDGQYCRTSVLSERKATRDIKVAIPGDLIDNAATSAVIRPYLRDLFTNWRAKGASMVQDSWGTENFQVFRHGPALSVVFHEQYNSSGVELMNGFRTFTFDMNSGRQLQLSDITKPGVDPLVAIPPLVAPIITEALDRARPPYNQPGTYPFTVDRWTPPAPFSGNYKAWALTPNELILYLPDYPVAHDTPIRYDMLNQWSMNGGVVQAQIPLAILSPVLRPEFGGA
ncbi:MAG: mannan-binding protein [Mycolicibacterium sp.]|uniref:mannan-binding protein n=1 Tax=Mycolicibacterium sp. TaxID=2320850 RepID=UPI003D0B818F